MYSKDKIQTLDARIEKMTIRPEHNLIATISTADLMTAIKVAPSYKVLVPSQTDDNLLVTNYINERCYYGSRPYLNMNAILLYMYVHFLNPSAYGKFILSTKVAAHELGLSERTIKYNMKVLLRHDYVTYIESNTPGVYECAILRYDAHNESANKGGRGYISLPYSTFEKMISSDTRATNINELRLQIRGLLQDLPGLNKNRLNSISIKDLKNLLPGYVKFKEIKQMLASDNIINIFGVSFSFDGKFCSMKTKPEYNSIEYKASIVDKAKDKIEKFVKTLSSKRVYKNSLLKISQSDIEDISKISLRIPIQNILAGIQSLFDKYAYQKITSVGGMVRTLAQESYDNERLFYPQL